MGIDSLSLAATSRRYPAGAVRLLPNGVDLGTISPILAGLALLFVPTCRSLYEKVWATDAQSFGPIILGIGLWFFWRERYALAALPASPPLIRGWLIFIASLLLYAVGRSQDILIFEVGSLVSILCALLIIFKGAVAIKLFGIQLSLLAFLIPWPAGVVAALTGPLKACVSDVAADLLHAAGYPVGRTGVMLTVGQYQFLVADACAGLSSIITLEAIGLVYIKLKGYQSVSRNIALASLIVPISLISNVVRVLILVLVTYHIGDEAGQGFLHGAAGIVLFAVAVILTLSLDVVIGVCMRVLRRCKRASLQT